MARPHFKQLFSVSDIHLGGPKGFQIFDQGQALAWLVDQLRTRDCDGDLALVLNGDIVDFLAEEPAMYLDAAGAVAKLTRIMQDPSFAPVWKALGRFVRKANRHLVLVLGNHDVELALPEVRALLADRLCGNSDAARGRLTFAMDGNGFACTVGKAKTLCIHGNETDTWNVVDYLALNHVIRARNRGKAFPEWTPNAGTKMVIDIMNDIKRKFRWVDLLKPEVQAVPALLVALEPKVLAKVRELPSLVFRLGVDSIRRSLNFLGPEAEIIQEQQTLALEQDILTTLSATPNPKIRQKVLDDAVADIEFAVAEGIEPYQLLDDEREGVETLGLAGAIWDLIRGRSPKENLREALENWLTEDATWDLKNEDSAFKAIDDIVGDDIDFVLAGHTHLRRAIRRPGRKGAYFNSGTWIRLMAITPEMLEDDDQFDKLWQVLKDGSMPVLDDPSSIGIGDFPVVKRIRTVIGLQADGNGQVNGQLFEVNGETVFRLDPVADSLFSGP